MSSKTRFAVAAGVALAVLVGGLLAYFSLDSRAKEKSSGKKGAGAIPVSVGARGPSSSGLTSINCSPSFRLA